MLKPTIDAFYGILRIENCKVKGIDGVPLPNKLALNTGHLDIEFDVRCYLSYCTAGCYD